MARRNLPEPGTDPSGPVDADLVDAEPVAMDPADATPEGPPPVDSISVDPGPADLGPEDPDLADPGSEDLVDMLPDANASELTDPAVTTGDSEVTDPLVVNELLGGKFVITRRLARGGMSVVYHAHQVGLARQVALKILRPPPDIQGRYDFAGWFHAEAQALAGFNHPNVVTLYDYGSVGDPATHGYYLAMEYVEGPSLAELLRSGPLPHPKAIGYVLDVCRALRYAHQNKVIHCDMKPSNVLIGEDDEGRDAVKVIDFGISRVEHGHTVDADAPLLGSPQSMAPEQIRGEPLSPATDVYGVGTLLVKCLTGRMPFRGATPRETLDMQLHATPPRLAELAPGQTFSPALEELVQRCLAKDPAQRYADMNQLMAALRRARPVSDEELTGSLVLPPEVRPEPRAAAGSGARHRAGYAITGAAIILALGVAAWMLGLASAPVPPPAPPPELPDIPAPPPTPMPALPVEAPTPAPPAAPETRVRPASEAPAERPPARSRSGGRRETPRPARRPSEPTTKGKSDAPAETKKKPDGYMDMPEF